MKKILIGCGCLTVLMATVCIGFFVWVGLQAQKVVANFEEAVLAVENLERDFPFSEPETRRLSTERLNQYFTVREAMISAVEQHPTYGKFLSMTGMEQLGPMETIRAMTGAPSFFATSVAGPLRDAQMSPSEYVWILETVSSTIAIGAEERNDPGMRRILAVADNDVPALNNVVQSFDGQPVGEKFQRSIASLRSRPIPEGILLQNMAAVISHEAKLTGRPRLLLLELAYFGEMRKALQDAKSQRAEAESPDATQNSEPVPVP